MSMAPPFESQTQPLLSLAIQAAEAGGRVLRSYFQSRSFEIQEKPQAGLVTQADIESQAVILQTLSTSPLHPSLSFLAEEEQPSFQNPPSPQKELGRWIIDPLDGTTNFVHGLPLFCVSIALEWMGELVLGVIHHPLFQETYSAIRGQGAFLNQRPIRVSSTTEPRKAFLSTGFSYDKKRYLRSEIQTLELVQTLTTGVRRTGSAALDLAYTAAGIFDGFWGKNLQAWDIAAGSLLISEAGGKVTHLSGGLFQVDTGKILASNPPLHSFLLEKILSSTDLTL